jgi:hypothetical protein
MKWTHEYDGLFKSSWDSFLNIYAALFTVSTLGIFLGLVPQPTTLSHPLQ